MRKLVDVELSSRNGLYTELSFPTTPYSILDALEKLRLEANEEPEWFILRSLDSQDVIWRFDQCGSLTELNTLCEQLVQLDERQLAIVQGLVDMEEPIYIPMSRFIDIVYSTDRCHFLEGITDDAQLGRFCAENGFVSEADDLSDEAFELLDFAKIGQEFLQDVGGVFTPCQRR